MLRLAPDRRLCLAGVLALMAGPALGQRTVPRGAGLANASLLLIRHAEQPDGEDTNPGLTAAGGRRAKAYARYFNPFEFDGQKLHIDALVAATDTPVSQRPRRTIEPLGQALSLPIQQPFADDDAAGLTRWLGAGAPGRTTLIAWRHDRLPALLAALGADTKSLMPDGVWPSTIFDWVMVLRYDATGRLAVAKVVHEPAELGK